MARLVVPFGFQKAFTERVVVIEAATVGELMAQLRARAGEENWKKLSRAFILVNGVAVSRLRGDVTPLSQEDEVWLVFPAGGG
jgi:molybdopterin converting factor small subunit